MAHSVQTFSKIGVIVQFNARVAARVSPCRRLLPYTRLKFLSMNSRLFVSATAAVENVQI